RCSVCTSGIRRSACATGIRRSACTAGWRRSRAYQSAGGTGSAGAGLVPDSPDGQDDLRALRIRFDLGAESLDVDVDQPGIGCVPVAPDLLQQHLPGEHLPGLTSQGDEQVKLQRGELDLVGVPADRVRGYVDGDLVTGRPDG